MIFMKWQYEPKIYTEGQKTKKSKAFFWRQEEGEETFPTDFKTIVIDTRYWLGIDKLSNRIKSQK